ncbi:WD repeat protein [Cryptosporidium canis]|uniref:WD repeat protein n=1 Tax=Cryptosporidium canis TaxID=195482 RepID=A0A9D5DJK2_9CRYT|nr:WD repeat protein [Cryptosporidium canis]
MRFKYISRFESTEVYHGLGIPISMAYSKNFWDGAGLCVGDSEGYISIYFTGENIADKYTEECCMLGRNEKKFSRKLHSGSVTDTKFQNVGFYSEKVERYVYSASTDSFLVKFDLEYEKESCKLRAHREWVKKFCISAEPSSIIATVGNDGSLRIYDDREFHVRGSYLGQSDCYRVGKECNNRGSTRSSRYPAPNMERNYNFNERYYDAIEKVNLVPIFDFSRIHDHYGRKGISREKMIGNKGISVSGVTFLSESNYIATSGSTDGHIKVWDIRKASCGNKENAMVFKFATQKDEESQRGIIWMESDELYNKLAIQTRKGTIYVYSVSGILSCSDDISSLTIDTNKLFHEEENIELFDASQRPSISSDGEWLITASNSGSRFCVFNISVGLENPAPYYIHECQEEESIPTFQCFAWERDNFNMGKVPIFPLKDCKMSSCEAKCVGREYRLNFSVGTKLRKLCFYNNKEFQLDIRRAVMPNFSGVSAGGNVTNSRATIGRGEENNLKPRWVSGEALSCSNSFDGDMDVINQLSLSSSLSVPFPKPNRTSHANDIDATSNCNNERQAEESQRSGGTQTVKKTGFLTVGGIGFSEKDSQSLCDESAFGRSTPVTESIEKTPFRRSIPFMGSSQDSVGYPAPQRRQSSYMTQSQESLLTPLSSHVASVNSREVLITDGEEAGNAPSSSSCDFNSRRIIHIPLSQSNEEMLASPNLDRAEFSEADCTDYSEYAPPIGTVTPGSSYRNINVAQLEDMCEETKKGFKQRRLDSWVRVRKSTEGGSTANCSTAELSPIS